MVVCFSSISGAAEDDTTNNSKSAIMVALVAIVADIDRRVMAMMVIL